MDKARQPTHGWARRGKQLLWAPPSLSVDHHANRCRMISKQNWTICVFIDDAAQVRSGAPSRHGAHHPWSVAYAGGCVTTDLVMTSVMGGGRTAAACCYRHKRPGAASRAARMRGSPASMSTILVRLAAPETRRTALRRTPNDPATAASAASVALPSTARALTRTTRAPSCSPLTPGRAEPGLTRIVIRTQPVSASNPGQAGCRAIRMVSSSRRASDREPPICAALSQPVLTRLSFIPRLSVAQMPAAASAGHMTTAPRAKVAVAVIRGRPRVRGIPNSAPVREPSPAAPTGRPGPASALS